MALNFPDNPSVNDVYRDSTSGFAYQWDGTVWQSYSDSSLGQIQVLDDISGSFNSSTQTFALTSSSAAITPANAQQIRVVLGGVVQDPASDYTVSGSNITFTTPPAGGLSFSGVVFGTAFPISTIVDGTVTEGSLRISTKAVVGAATTFTEDLVVNGSARVVGVLTVGTSNLTLNGDTNQINGVTISSGIITASSFFGDGSGLTGVGIGSTGDINTTGIITASSFVGDGSALTGISAGFTPDADENLIAGTGAGGSYDPATGTACLNIFLGCNAGNSITSGDGNNFLGYSTGKCNTTGSHNNFLGYSAGYYNCSGGDNNFLGYQSGKCNTTGGNNNFLGYSTGNFNTTGSNNNFLGCSAGYCNCSGSNNNFLGCRAGRCNTSGCYNNFFGSLAGYYNTTGCHNNFLGFYAGKCNTSGSNNIAIGRNAGQIGSPPSGLISLTTTDNCIVMGNACHSCAAIQIAWTVISDIRDKCVYGDVPHGKGFLQNVNPIKYSFKDRETGEVTDEKVRYGFSAQEIAELEGDETIISSKSNTDKWGVTHEHLLPVLVNAIKELDAENKELKERLITLEEKVNSFLES